MARKNSHVTHRTHGICYHPSHDPLVIGGTIMTGSDTIKSTSQDNARITDLVLSDCGHEGRIITGNDTIIDTQQSCAGVTDRTDGYYKATIIEGEDTLKIG